VSKTSRLSSLRRKGALRAHGLHGAVQTLRARHAFLARFLIEVDPNGELPQSERKRRARYLLRAYMIGLALRRHADRSLDKTKNAARVRGGASEVPDDGGHPSTES